MPVRVALDAHGSDAQPGPEVEGALEAVRAGTRVVMVGDQPRLEKEAKLREDLPAELSFVHAPATIGMEDEPSRALRRKRDTSMVRAFDLVKRGEADAVVTAGNSGAALMLGTFMLGRIPGVIRPAILNHLPTLTNENAVLLDGGANVDCRPEWLVQFASMGAVYARTVLGRNTPRIGLLANGTEEGKGNELVRETHARLKGTPGYAGLTEPNEVFEGKVDVLVVDGFSGNLLLKAAEGTVDAVLKMMKREIEPRPLSRVGAFLARRAFRSVRKKTGWDEYGAGVLIGVTKPAFIAHGRSNPKAIENAIGFARRISESGLIDALAKSGLERRLAGHA